MLGESIVMALIAADKVQSPHNATANDAIAISSQRGRNRLLATTLPSGVLAIGVSGYAGMLGSFWIAFGSESQVVFVLVIVTMFALIYSGLPLVMARAATLHSAQKRRPQYIADFVAGDFETLTGPISGWSALVQFAVLPIALAFGVLAIGIINVSLR
jgi:hypothetical protein